MQDPGLHMPQPEAAAEEAEAAGSPQGAEDESEGPPGHRGRCAGTKNQGQLQLQATLRPHAH